MTSAAALLGAAALVVSVVPAQAASPGPQPPEPGQVIAGQRTETPALVDGIREPAAATGAAADAARGHLAAKEGRYHIAEPARDLRPVRTVTTGTREVVRLQQKHRGVDVLGAQYVVRMEREGGKRIVTGTSGRYFTGLRTGVTSEVDEALAIERAVDTTTDRLVGKRIPKDGVPPLTGTAHGLVVLPRGEGVLTRHVTVRGAHPVTGEPVRYEVYVDAENGYPVLQYSAIKTFRAPGAGAAARADGQKADGQKASDAASRRLRDEPGPVKGSGVTFDGTTVELPLAWAQDRGQYVMRDHTRMADTSKNTLATWDARGLSVGEVTGSWPYGIQEFGSPTPDFGKDATEAGAVNAHWGAGQVYDYYRRQHGRDSIDGWGMAVNSLVGVSDGGAPFVDSFWDGDKAVFGAGDEEYRPFSAGLDVVGHELTSGVVERSAGLVYAGQSGALSEALADYFGNAIETDVRGIPMDSPDSGLLGESLCRTKSPRACAVRDLNDGRTTSKSFLGVSFGTDNGGVHLNSTIFSGALWDLREDLGGTLADRIVYKALTEYMTPLDGFTEGRAAVLAAARGLQVTDAQLRAAERAFSAHGIVPGWEPAMGVDSDVLLERVNTAYPTVGAGGGWWVTAKSNENGTEPSSIWAGRTDGTGAPQLISPNDGRIHDSPVTDGKTVVWVAHNRRSASILARPLTGGLVKTLWQSGRRGPSSLAVEGDVVVFARHPSPGAWHVEYLRMSNPKPVPINEEEDVITTSASLAHGRIAYVRVQRHETGRTYDTEVYDLKTGQRTRMGQLGQPTSLGQTAVNGKHVFWLVPTDDGSGSGIAAVRRADLDGTNVVDISPGDGPEALRPADLLATEDAVTVPTYTPVPDTGPAPEYRNETLGKIWQLSVDGTQKGRVSCNRGEQVMPAVPGGRQVIWVDGTTGRTNLVTRTRPAGRCG
ncbi:M4 family metallopeptidase [Streptomyces sp. NPDC003077]|uniref:M4 family metallopeptidase n=1 Tax=Streptomyces sp. NPDC003077 TaxID=3154443 RepID=UPI0033A4700B